MMDFDRFGGIGRLYGRRGLESLSQARMAVIGIGGVGSWVAESLARSGVGCLILMDLDDLCITNTNRQIHALADTVGRSKNQVMAERIKAINPACEVLCIDRFFSVKSAGELLAAKPDVIVDAIDSMGPKAYLIQMCYKQKLPLVTCGGAGGRIDPTRIEVADLSKTKGDPMLSSLRKKLRKEYGLPLGENARKLHIPCVFSQESPVYPTCEGETSASKDPQFSGRMGCDAGFGSVTHITGSFGFFAAAEAIKLYLSKNN